MASGTDSGTDSRTDSRKDPKLALTELPKGVKELCDSYKKLKESLNNLEKMVVKKQDGAIDQAIMVTRLEMETSANLKFYLSTFKKMTTETEFTNLAMNGRGAMNDLKKVLSKGEVSKDSESEAEGYQDNEGEDENHSFDKFMESIVEKTPEIAKCFLWIFQGYIKEQLRKAFESKDYTKPKELKEKVREVREKMRALYLAEEKNRSILDTLVTTNYQPTKIDKKNLKDSFENSEGEFSLTVTPVQDKS